MNFATPNLLFLLLIPALLLAWVWRRRTGEIVLPLDHASVRPTPALGVLTNVAESIPPLLLAIAILLLAVPVRLGEPETKRALTNIEFCVDVSGSMTAGFGEGTRYDASLEAINKFLDYREGDAFGLTFFGHNVLHWIPLTSDVSAFRCAAPFMNPNNPNHPPWMGGTMIGQALRACKKRLVDREEGDRMIVLISDGESYDLSQGQDQEMARELREANVTVFAVNIGSPEAPDSIANVTGLTGGAVFSPSDPAALTTVFQRIDAMQPVKLEKTSAELIDDFGYYCHAGLLLLGLATLAQFGLRYTPW